MLNNAEICQFNGTPMRRRNNAYSLRVVKAPCILGGRGDGMKVLNIFEMHRAQCHWSNEICRGMGRPLFIFRMKFG